MRTVEKPSKPRGTGGPGDLRPKKTGSSPSFTENPQDSS